MNLVSKLQQYIGDYGIKEGKGAFFTLFKFIIVSLTGYNHEKYWKRRSYVIDPNKKNVLKKICYLLYVKKVDAKHMSSFGTSYNSGSHFGTPPILPHGMNSIIVGHDASIGCNVTIYQQVTIAQGGVKIGDNVMLGAGSKILNGVTIGDNAKVGANCVVVQDIPADATCVLPKSIIIIKNEK